MKKTYYPPTFQEVGTASAMPLATSGVTSGNGIGYGGVDEDGSLDPSVKENSFNFDWE